MVAVKELGDGLVSGQVGPFGQAGRASNLADGIIRLGGQRLHRLFGVGRVGQGAIEWEMRQEAVGDRPVCFGRKFCCVGGFPFALGGCQ